ncbi:methyltransferase domain-containing protein [Shewanella sp. JM162201]|uniref:Methyltransferase domain-containing protein n=1 Tax=Shewanella jiangmenensis TaxID=2837387 RepID=A0ABS5V894_9GAMM|nr:class I SAM-dependent methyltransferase [Shewanella jiangmenensis]MBT1445228.1 methyltransferase domain-containing protein [Shewanella jiangmenensis]
MKTVKPLIALISLMALFEPAWAADVPANADTQHAKLQPAISAALAAAERPAADKARDAQRKPDVMLNFFEVEPGQKVLDIFSGGGYYTELLARVVGKEGTVVAHNNQAYLPFAGEELKQRQYDKRLPNVQPLLAEANDLRFAEASFDRIFFVLGFHDAFFSDKDWPAIDVDKLTALMFRSLRPGGKVAIIDHRAKAGSDIEVAKRLHRIDPAIIIEKMTAAGFVLEAQSDALKNSADDLEQSVFSEQMRGRSDRFVLKFTRL